jgi:hypothetical protein
MTFPAPRPGDGIALLEHTPGGMPIIRDRRCASNVMYLMRTHDLFPVGPTNPAYVAGQPVPDRMAMSELQRACTELADLIDADNATRTQRALDDQQRHRFDMLVGLGLDASEALAIVDAHTTDH